MTKKERQDARKAAPVSTTVAEFMATLGVFDHIREELRKNISTKLFEKLSAAANHIRGSSYYVSLKDMTKVSSELKTNKSLKTLYAHTLKTGEKPVLKAEAPKAVKDDSEKQGLSF